MGRTPRWAGSLPKRRTDIRRDGSVRRDVLARGGRRKGYDSGADLSFRKLDLPCLGCPFVPVSPLHRRNLSVPVTNRFDPDLGCSESRGGVGRDPPRHESIDNRDRRGLGTGAHPAPTSHEKSIVSPGDGSLERPLGCRRVGWEGHVCTRVVDFARSRETRTPKAHLSSDGGRGDCEYRTVTVSYRRILVRAGRRGGGDGTFSFLGT